MKKILSFLFAGLIAFAAVSCYPDDIAVFDSSKATAPVISSYELGAKALTISYTPGKFNAGFNDKMPVNHSFIINSIDGKSVSKTVSAASKDNVMSVSVSALNNLFLGMGYVEDDVVSFDAVIRATMQNPAQDNGRNGFVDSKETVSITGFVITLPKGSPYQDYTETSPFSVIGSLSAYEISWDGDLEMWMTPDGNQHVAKCVTINAGDEFKFRKDQDWAVNYGGDFGGLDNAFAVSQDGPNIVAPAGLYDLWLDLAAGTATLTEAYQAYPDHKDASNWTVIGSLAEYGMSWDGDLLMVTDGTTHIAQGIKITASDEFKFRQDKSWDVNLGGPFGGVGNEFTVTQGGDNIVVGVEGIYDLIVNPGAGTAQVVETLGGGKSGKIGGDEPGPEPTPVTGWNIIGLNGDWDNDIIATNDGDLWTAFITAVPAEGEETTEFKWRKDGGWDENYGGDFVALGEPFEAVAGGSNIKVPAGFWKVVLDVANLTITVSNGEVWSLIGDFNGWSGDVDLIGGDDGVWVSPPVQLNANGFKIRHNHDWALSVGGNLVNLGEPFEAISQDGPNIMLTDSGTYIVEYNTVEGTITVSALGWGVVGSINSWGGSPDVVLKEEAGKSYLVARNIAVTASDEIKIRKNNDWSAGDYGAATNLGHSVKAVPGGSNIKPGIDGAIDVYFFERDEVIIVAPAGEEIVYWGVVGTINGWGAPDFIMYEDENGNFVYEDLTVTANDEIKIRMNEVWAGDRGGTFVEFDEAFEVSNGGPNIKVGRDAVITLTYDPTADTMVLSGEYSGDAPELPSTMYIIGDGVGGWDWSADYIVDMTPVNGKTGQFWAIRNIEAGKGFKFCAVREWSGDFTGLGTDTGYTVSDGNCFVEETGVYMIYVDTENKKVCVEKAKVYGIGDCFGGWSENMETALFTEVDGKLVGTTAAAGEIRLYAASSIATSDWWTREFVFFDGVIAYRGNGGDQERVAVEAGKKVTLDFNAGTATVE